MMDKNRKVYLDGVRGCACMMVVLSHVVQLYVPSILSGTSYLIESLGKIPFLFPFTLVYNGNMGVYLFFLIGGFVSVKQKPYNVGQRIKKRYLRLAIPVFLSCVIAMLMANKIGPLYNSLDSITHNEGVRIDPSQYSLLQVIKYSCLDVFLSRAEFQKEVLRLNHVLWTIRIEFIGSILIYVIDSALTKPEDKGIVYLLTVMLLPAGGGTPAICRCLSRSDHCEPSPG